jgi:tetratricopeptide (TPR) repeat protein
MRACYPSARLATVRHASGSGRSASLATGTGSTRARVPLDRAMTQMNLGKALEALGERESGTARLEEAVAAHRAALEEFTRARVPLQWATTQMNLGSALTALAILGDATLGEPESGTARLEEAVAAYRAALGVLTKDAAPYYHQVAQGGFDLASNLLANRRHR